MCDDGERIFTSPCSELDHRHGGAVMTAVTRRTETHIDVQHTTDTARARWRALSAWAGIAFVPVFFLGVFFASNLPDSNDSDAKVSAWYNRKSVV
jgi:hypothetical protein